MTKAMIAVLGCVVLSGCAYRPIVDPARSDMVRFESDLAECRQIAEQAPGPGAARSKRAVIRNCLTGRGHAVLN